MAKISIGILLLSSLTRATYVQMMQQQQLLDLNQDKWDFFVGSPNNTRGYIMDFERSCFCMPEQLGPFQVAVNSTGDVVSATYLADSTNPGMRVSDLKSMDLITIQDAFDGIQRALDENVHYLNATYDAVAGFPRVVSIDWDVMIADEEIYFKIDNVVML